AVATCLLPESTWTSFFFRSVKNALAFSSPQAAKRQVACVAVVPKSGLAIAILPLNFGSRRSARPLGRSASATSLVLTTRIRALAAKPYQVPSFALNSPGMSAAFGGDQLASIPFSPRRSVLRISLFQNRSHRGLGDSWIR